MIAIYYLFAAILVFLSAKLFIGGVRYLAYFKAELGKPVSVLTPFVTVIAPCRGADQGLDKNLRSLLSQSYPGYEVVFVVDNIHDSSVPIIEETRATTGRLRQNSSLQNGRMFRAKRSRICARAFCTPMKGPRCSSSSTLTKANVNLAKRSCGSS